MPLPTPNSGESHDDFFERCMSNDVAVDEFPAPPQRAAVCQRQWEGRNKMERTVFEIKRLAVDADTAGPGSFEGYGATWDLDQGGDVILRGAFKDALPDFLARGFVPVSHDWGALPIATVSAAKEDDTGLWFEAEFHSTQAAQDVRTVMAERLARDKFVGLSIGYLLDTDEASQEFTDDGIRKIKRVRDLLEVSIVTLPMNRAAGVAGVKASLGAGSLDEHLQLVAAEAQSVARRAHERLEYRRKEGRVLSAANRGRLSSIRDELRSAAGALDGILADTEPAANAGADEHASKTTVTVTGLHEFRRALRAVDFEARRRARGVDLWLIDTRETHDS